MRWSRVLLAGLGLVCVAQAAHAQVKSMESRGSVILQNVASGFDGIQDFVAAIEATVDMERLRMPKMTATMYFKKPDKVHFDSPSFAMLPREGVIINASSLNARYDAAVLGEEPVDGKKLLKLQLTAKDQKTRPRQLFLWVDQTLWVIARMESVPYQGRVLRLEFTHGQTGGYTLPQTLKATFESTGRDTTQRPLDIDPDMAGQLGEMRQRPSRSGSIFVKYLEYKINVGLADDIFEKKENQLKSQ